MCVDVQKLNLLLTSGEHIDVIYAANYQNIRCLCGKGRLFAFGRSGSQGLSRSSGVRQYGDVGRDACRRESLHGALYVGGMGTLWLPLAGGFEKEVQSS